MEISNNKSSTLVVLGAAVWEGGEPSPSLKRRIGFAIELMNKGYTGSLLLSGGVGKHPPSEAAVMLSLVKEAGIDDAKIILEEAGTTTWHSAQECSKIIIDRQLTDVIIVTDHYHMARALLAFGSFGINAAPCPLCKGHSGTTTLRWLYQYLREIIALPWYLILFFVNRFKRAFG